MLGCPTRSGPDGPIVSFVMDGCIHIASSVCVVWPSLSSQGPHLAGLVFLPCFLLQHLHHVPLWQSFLLFHLCCHPLGPVSVPLLVHVAVPTIPTSLIAIGRTRGHWPLQWSGTAQDRVVHRRFVSGERHTKHVRPLPLLPPSWIEVPSRSSIHLDGGSGADSTGCLLESVDRIGCAPFRRTSHGVFSVLFLFWMIAEVLP